MCSCNISRKQEFGSVFGFVRDKVHFSLTNHVAEFLYFLCVMYRALRIYLQEVFLMRGGDLSKEQNKELFKRLYNICH